MFLLWQVSLDDDTAAEEPGKLSAAAVELSEAETQQQANPRRA